MPSEPNRCLPTSPLPCAICGAAAASVVHRDSVPRLDNTFELVRCLRCGLTRVDPAPTEEALRGYYEAYAEHMAAAGRTIMSDAEALARARADISDLERLRAPGRLLDIGCGGGHLLRAAAQRGWQVFGAETGTAAVTALRREFGRERIWPADAGVRDLTADLNSFDAIVLRHVLEHVRDPGAMLRRARELLARGGILLCEVPDVNALRIRLRRRALMGQLHLWHFSAHSLDALLARCGFGVEEICFRDHRGPAATRWRRAARGFRFALENAAWRWLGVDLGTNLRVYATRAAESRPS
jgi:SAM-dependent methyltransferase